MEEIGGNPNQMEKEEEEEFESASSEENFDSESSSEEDDDTDDEEEEEEKEKWITHYSSKHRILLVGDGDFSFSLCLARAFGSARNMVATSLDSPENIERKYSNGISNVRELEERGCLVLYGVDAKQMREHFFLKTQRFDRIVYNFPHVGFLYREASYCQIHLNKRLVKGFLENAKVLLKKEVGEIHVTHKEGDPYDRWDIVRKAEKIGLALHEGLPFRKNDYPGYNNKRAHGTFSNSAFRIGDSTTFKFKINCSSKFA